MSVNIALSLSVIDLLFDSSLADYKILSRIFCDFYEHLCIRTA